MDNLTWDDVVPFLREANERQKEEFKLLRFYLNAPGEKIEEFEAEEPREERPSSLADGMARLAEARGDYAGAHRIRRRQIIKQLMAEAKNGG